MKNATTPGACLLACLVLLAAPSALTAGIRPSFFLDDLAWRATDVVVASEVDLAGGRLSVIETWKGRLSPGDALSIAELREFADAESRTEKTVQPAKDKTSRPVIVSGKRMVLFLTRPASGLAREGGIWKGWEPASEYGGFAVSVAWIEGGNSYAIVQSKNPGLSELCRQTQSEVEMKMRVMALMRTQGSLAKLAGIPETGERAKRAAEYVRSDIYLARTEAFRILAGSGKPALPVLRHLLEDKSNADQYGDIINAMAAAGGRELGPEFVGLLENELAFWKAKAPSLQKGWWNGTGLQWSEVEAFRSEYVKSINIVGAFREWKLSGAREAVRAFRDCWRSLPQLGDDSGLDQMRQACDAVLNALDESP